MCCEAEEKGGQQGSTPTSASPPTQAKLKGMKRKTGFRNIRRRGCLDRGWGMWKAVNH